DGSAVDWSLQLIRALLHRAATLLRMERAGEAAALLAEATPILEARLSEAPEQRDMVVQVSELHALRSRLLAREGREAGAERELSAGLDLLRPIAEGSSDPAILVQWLDLLRLAGERERADTVSRQLESMGVVLSPLPKNP
ncbi:MAG TPA: hypothetical protein VMT85_04400, partial [Thermoanaerobaculia bacterium]|nr:hypothetical protein [Thermoanaerobaculia bacterium]